MDATPDRDPDAVLAEQIVARFEASFAPRPSTSPALRAWRGRRALDRSRTYLAFCADTMLAAIAAGDPWEAAHWAKRAAHEVGYQDWAQARLDGRPYRAYSTRPSNPWIDHYRAAPTTELPC